MSKKIIALLLVLCLALSLAACSSGGSNEQSSQSQESSQTQEPSQSSESSTVEESSEPTEEPDESSEESSEAPEVNESGLRPAKTAKDSQSISDEETQELLSYMGKSISEEYLVPNGISAADFAWPTDETAWEYYDALLTKVYFKVAVGIDRDELITEDIIPASPDKEIMEAATDGVLNWCQLFESVESVYLDYLFIPLRDYQYVQGNVTFE